MSADWSMTVFLFFLWKTIPWIMCIVYSGLLVMAHQFCFFSEPPHTHTFVCMHAWLSSTPMYHFGHGLTYRPVWKKNINDILSIVFYLAFELHTLMRTMNVLDQAINQKCECECGLSNIICAIFSPPIGGHTNWLKIYRVTWMLIDISRYE